MWLCIVSRKGNDHYRRGNAHDLTNASDVDAHAKAAGVMTRYYLH
jgi:hypothetical protein